MAVPITIALTNFRRRVVPMSRPRKTSHRATKEIRTARTTEAATIRTSSGTWLSCASPPYRCNALRRSQCPLQHFLSWRAHAHSPATGNVECYSRGDYRGDERDENNWPVVPNGNWQPKSQHSDVVHRPDAGPMAVAPPTSQIHRLRTPVTAIRPARSKAA